MTMRFQIHGTADVLRWRLIGAGGEVRALAGTAYLSMEHGLPAIRTVMDTDRTTLVENMTVSTKPHQ